MIMHKIVIVSGGFDPIHAGHIEYFNEARKLGDKLVVGVNSDEWLERKKGRKFMAFEDRLKIVKNIRCVDYATGFKDDDDSAINLILKTRLLHPEAELIFANGGDRTSANIPEMNLVSPLLSFAFGVGGENKINSSSWILDEWKAPKTFRPWGYYRVLHEVDGMKVKELTVNPGQTLSMQRHSLRAEDWIVSDGICNIENGEGIVNTLEKHDKINIPVNTWHRLHNPFKQPCKIVEIQYGEECIEKDIERR